MLLKPFALLNQQMYDLSHANFISKFERCILLGYFRCFFITYIYDSVTKGGML